MKSISPPILIVTYLVFVCVTAFHLSFSTLFLSTAVMAILSQLSLSWIRRCLLSLKYSRILIISIAVFHVGFTPGDEFLELGFLTVSQQGIYRGLLQGWYLVLMICAIQLLWERMREVEFLSGLLYLLKPLQTVGVPIARFGVLITLVLSSLKSGFDLPDVKRAIQETPSKNPLKIAANAVNRAIDSPNEIATTVEPNLSYTMPPPHWWEWAVPVSIGTLIVLTSYLFN